MSASTMSASTYDLLSSISPSRYPRRVEPAYPGVLATDGELCRHWRDLDAHYSTDPGSPLHHDWRCQLHNPA